MRHPNRPPLAGLAALLMITALPACDNVEWGGADIEVVPPPPPPSAVRLEPDAQVFAEFGLPSGTVLFHLLQRDEQPPQLIPVAEVRGGTLRTLRRPPGVSPQAYEQRFRETVLPPGAQFSVFRRGAEVGTFTVQGAGPVTGCGVPTATGNLTTVAAATDVPQFLAFRRGLEPQVRGDYNPPTPTRQISTYASIVAERLVLQQGLSRPRSWPGARKDLTAIEIAQGAHPEMAATYLVGDSLAVGPASPQGWSVFYIADYEPQRGYTPLYREVRDYRQGGKAAPVLVDYLNWDAEEGEEILVQIFGEDQRWYEVISQTEAGEWERVWEGERC